MTTLFSDIQRATSRPPLYLSGRSSPHSPTGRASPTSSALSARASSMPPRRSRGGPIEHSPVPPVGPAIPPQPVSPLVSRLRQDWRFAAVSAFCSSFLPRLTGLDFDVDVSTRPLSCRLHPWDESIEVLVDALLSVWRCWTVWMGGKQAGRRLLSSPSPGRLSSPSDVPNELGQSAGLARTSPTPRANL